MNPLVINVNNIIVDQVSSPKAGSPPAFPAKSEPAKTTEERSSAPSYSELAKMTEDMQKTLDSLNVALTFGTYGKSDDLISIMVTHKETGEVIREIPPEEIQQLYEKMNELVGLLFNRSA